MTKYEFGRIKFGHWIWDNPKAIETMCTKIPSFVWSLSPLSSSLGEGQVKLRMERCRHWGCHILSPYSLANEPAKPRLIQCQLLMVNMAPQDLVNKKMRLGWNTYIDHNRSNWTIWSFCFGMIHHSFYLTSLTGAKRREWMGCWGLLGWLLIVTQWIIPENSLRLAPVRSCRAKKWSAAMRPSK